MANNEKLRNKIVKQLNSDNARTRKKAIKNSAEIIDEEILDQLILMLHVDEKENVRKEIVNLFSKLPSLDNNLESKVISILEKVSENEPNEEFKMKAKSVLTKRKK